MAARFEGIDFYDIDALIGGWIATIVAAVWIGARPGREIAYGVMRFANSKAVDARPPDGPVDPG